VAHPMEFKAGEMLEVVGELPDAIPSDHYSVLDEPMDTPIKPSKAKKNMGN